jgi:glycosyltransferase involved in cell wall biosynthesis
MTVSVIIPAWNEAESIASVLAEIPSEFVNEVLVIDGGSTDGTPEIAAACGARVLVEARRGYGQACATGAAAAKGEFLVFMDADGADDPSRLPDFLALLNADAAIGAWLTPGWAHASRRHALAPAQWQLVLGWTDSHPIWCETDRFEPISRRTQRPPGRAQYAGNDVWLANGDDRQSCPPRLAFGRSAGKLPRPHWRVSRKSAARSRARCWRPGSS